ncbi:Alcohol dehydrogenase-like 7 [Artemisia annua]|uniref:Alcohol dehydrogenase-like 7 n=1 Tax=Artemisia annua TaxID=35608 RepID=A0A2U1N3V8_ARTAN|nr:Alcohol dehydrogenase-like 7 [Artemisia annua]
MPDCGECTDCLSEKSNLCTKLPFKVSPWMDREETSRFTDMNGETLHHFLFVSSFSEYTVVDIAHLTKIDPSTPANRACLLSCGVSTGVGAAWKTAKVETGTTVAIFGLGKKFGVTDFVNSRNCGDKTVSQVIMEMTGGGADYCFECVGMTSLVHEAYASCRKGWGKTVVLGVDQPGAMLTFRSSEVLHSGKSLMGSLFGGLKPKSDIPILIKRYMDKELQLDEFVTHEVDFEDINKAFDLLLEGKSLRAPAALQESLSNAEDAPAIFPRILGHEAVGVVESIGEGVHEVAQGDTVVPVFLPDCGECTDCLSNKSNLCSNFTFSISPWMQRQETSRFTDINGEPLYHFMFVSSFSEYTVVDIAHVTKIDPQAPPNRACLLTCGIGAGKLCSSYDAPAIFPRILGHEAVGVVESIGEGVHEVAQGDTVVPVFLPDCGEWVGAPWKRAEVEVGTTVAIFGLGSIGLAVAEGARSRGAKRIIGVDVNEDRFELAKKFGVTDFVNSRNCGDKTVSQIIIEMTDGGADYCFECVGLTSMIQEAYASSRQGWGKTVVLGYDLSGEPLTLSSYEVLHSGKSITGSLFGGLKPKHDVLILIKRYMDKVTIIHLFLHLSLNFEVKPLLSI